MFEDCQTPPLLETHETKIVDSGCTGHFLLVNAPCLSKVKYQNPLTVHLPNGATMESTHTEALDIPELNKAASIAHLFPGMANHSLLSVGQLCNEGYTVTFRIESVTIHNSQGIQMLRGARDLDTRLWRINLRKEHQQPQQEVENNIYEHKSMFSPTKSAPGLTEHAINKHLELTPATTMGHMNQRRQNIRST
jgi:hypothetical protein